MQPSGSLEDAQATRSLVAATLGGQSTMTAVVGVYISVQQSGDHSPESFDEVSGDGIATGMGGQV